MLSPRGLQSKMIFFLIVNVWWKWRRDKGKEVTEWVCSQVTRRISRQPPGKVAAKRTVSVACSTDGSCHQTENGNTWWEVVTRRANTPQPTIKATQNFSTPTHCRSTVSIPLWYWMFLESLRTAKARSSTPIATSFKAWSRSTSCCFDRITLKFHEVTLGPVRVTLMGAKT